MKRSWLVYIIGFAAGLHFRKPSKRVHQMSYHDPSADLLDYLPVEVYDDRSSDLERPQTDHPERPTLLLAPKQMWASGLDARRIPAAFNANSSEWAPMLWTQQTVDAFRQVYNEAMNPSTCPDGDHVITAEKPFWGLTSRIRDFQDILIGGLSNGTLVLQKHGGGCPDEAASKPDPFMRCIFEPFSRCQTEASVHSNNSRAILRLTDVEDDPSKYTRPILDILKHSGLEVSGRVDAQQPVGHQYLGVIRSLLQTTAFKFSSRVEKRVAELESTFGKIDGPMLIVHIRRTDKVTDSSSMPHWFDVRDDQKQRVTLRQSLEAVLELIAFVESRSGKQYKSLYLMADDPRFFEGEYLTSLQGATAGNARILYNPYVIGSFGDDSGWTKEGHMSQSPKHHNAIDVELAADMRFVIKHGSHIVGCGRSGISQFIAQGLGAKYMVDPNALSAFEDDSLLLPQVMGKFQAERHLQQMAAMFATRVDGYGDLDYGDLDYDPAKVLQDSRVSTKKGYTDYGPIFSGLQRLFSLFS